MVLDRQLGALHEPLTGRRWEGVECARRVAERAAQLQRRGVQRGDRVFIHFGNKLEFFADLLAVWTLGGCVVPIDPRFTPFEIATLARAVAPRCSLWDDTPDPAVATTLAELGIHVACGSAEEPDANAHAFASGLPRLDDDALMLLTSGTTGQPKGVVHTHRSLQARWMSLRTSLGVAAFERTLCMLPTHFGHGLICNSLFPWLAGCDLHIVPPFRADLVVQLGTLLDDHAITFLSSVPSMWRLALKTARAPRRAALQRVFCGSAPLSAALWRDVAEWTGAKEVANAYGITETASWLAGTPAGVTPEDGLIGVPWGGVIRVVQGDEASTSPLLAEPCAPGEAGKVWVLTPALMKGYFGREDLTRNVVAQGWFLTGDIGSLDERGYLYLRGREREEINVGGMKIYPGDIDAVVERFEGVADACAFAYEDPLLGENVATAIVVRAGRMAALAGLHRWTEQYLARHQMPRRWYVVDEIPRTARGKINRAEVARACAGLAPVDLSGVGDTKAR